MTRTQAGTVRAMTRRVMTKRVVPGALAPEAPEAGADGNPGWAASDWDRLTDELDRLVAQTGEPHAATGAGASPPVGTGVGARPGASGVVPAVHATMATLRRRPARLAGGLAVVILAGATATGALTRPWAAASASAVPERPAAMVDMADVDTTGTKDMADTRPTGQAGAAPVPRAASARLAAPSRPRAAPASRLEDPTGLVRLVWSTLLAIRHGQETGNYAVLRDLAAPEFRDMQTAQSLRAAFAPLAARIDLADALLVAPRFSRAEQPEDGALRLTGRFALEPTPLAFDLLYAAGQVGGGPRWRLLGASLVPIDPVADASRRSGPPEAGRGLR